MNYYPFHIGDYISHTSHLSDAEDLAYRRMMDLYYQSEQPFTDINYVARRVKSTSEIVSGILSDFFLKTEDGWRNRRADEEILKYKAKAESARNANKAKQTMKSALKSELKSEPNQLATNNQEPITKNQEPINNTDIVDINIDQCPHQDIISIYKDVLPNGIQPLTWNGVRRSNLKARWREDVKRQNLDWWKGLFEYIKKSDFLMGKTYSKDKRPFEISLDKIVRPEMFNKIIEGQYHG